MSRYNNVDSIEEPQVKSARISEVSDTEGGEKDTTESDGESRYTEITPASPVLGVQSVSQLYSSLETSHYDWASKVIEWKRWGTIFLDCEEKLTRQSRDRNIDRKHISDYKNMMIMFSRFRMLAESHCGRVKLTTESRLYLSDLSLQGGKFVEVVKGECSWDDEEYQSSLEWFLRSIDRLNKYLRDGPAPSRPRSAPGNSRGNRAYRCMAWNQFLQNLNVNNKKESIPFSSVKVLPEPIDSLIKDEERVPVKEIGEAIMDYLMKNFGYARKVVKRLNNEASRIHFIAPILFCVGSLFEDIEIAFEEIIEGVTVKAHGRFEFLIKRRGKAVGIEEAKKDKVDEGVAHALLGCQVLVDNGTHAAYAIVTDFERWIFIRDTEEAIYRDTVYMPSLEEGFDANLLRQVVGKIHSILSDD